MKVRKVVIYKALHKGDVNNRFTRAYRKSTVRIAGPLRNEDCSTANLRTRQTGWYSVTKPLVHSGRKKRSAIYRTVFTYGTL
jgi:hypothetical protein